MSGKIPRVDEPSQPIELLLSVDRDAPETLGAQVEGQLRRAVREGALRAGARVPSTRDLARQLGVSRRVVIDAYDQLAAEGYLALRQGARPRVADGAAAIAQAVESAELVADRPARYDFRPAEPDVSTFPRAAWLRSYRDATTAIADADLSYGDANGVAVLRNALADYLGRVRGLSAQPARVVVTSGYTQGLGIVCRALAATGVGRVALEDPGDPEARAIVTGAGLEHVPVAVDDEGIRVDELRRSGVRAVVLTPAHHHPTGVVLSGARRTEVLAWLREAEALAIEDDYDAEYRYDRAAVGALQGLAPEHVVYAGTASKVLAPALRMGWLVVPGALGEEIRHQKLLADRGTARIEQVAFADFVTRGELDRHLRRVRALYRRRRELLVETIAEQLPDATVRGIAAGLHATVELPEGHDERAIRAAAHARRIEVETLGDYRLGDGTGPPTLLLGYAKMSEPALRAGIRELADVIRETRA